MSSKKKLFQLRAPKNASFHTVIDQIDLYSNPFLIKRVCIFFSQLQFSD